MEFPPVIILRGGPAVGKTILAALVADLLPRSAIVEQDVLRYMVRGGLVAARRGVHPALDPEGYATQCALADAHALALACSFTAAGFATVVAGFDGGESASSFGPSPAVGWRPVPEDALPGRPVHTFILDATPDVLVGRLRMRGLDLNAITFVLRQRERFLAGVPPTLPVVDSSATPPEVLARRIVETVR